jgi:translation initiation factor IF-2
MGKIRVKDLAVKMGVPEQDLLFKLKSIGVRVDDEENAQIDTSVIQAILEGKRLPQPREVILRDEEAKASAPSPRRRVPSRRLPPNPLRPQRRRPLIQRVEPRIKTIPSTEPQRPAPAETAPPEAPDVAAVTATPPEASPQTSAEAGSAEAKQGPTTKAKPIKKAAEKAPSATDTATAQTEPETVDETAKTEDRRIRRAERRKLKAIDTGQVLPFKVAAPEAPITISEGMTVREFADKLGVKSKDLIQVLLGQGIMATINHVLDAELALEVAESLGIEAMVVTFEEEVQLQQEQDLEGEESTAREPRPPVVTIMGHVDHGKTTLLDAIRSSKITEGEFGGITQHIGAYDVEIDGKKIAFVDTPGHEAFTMMRARGAKVTDIVILVVAADDGVMPQTVEALDHARAAQVPIIVAINKIDKADANPDRVKKELSEHGLTVEEWGGDTVSVALSALKREGVSELLEMIVLTSEILDLKANTDLPGQGAVLEARKEPGRGIVATVLVQDGVVQAGDIFVAGATWGRVRSMVDDLGEKIAQAGPSKPVEIAGFGDVPEAGDLFQVVGDESKARTIAEFRKEEQRQKDLAPTVGKVTLDQLFSQMKEGEIKELPIVLKADVQGSVEVLKDTLTKLSTDQVKLQVIHSGVGAITTNDVILASASGAIVVGFNVRPERMASELADKEEVELRLHTVIYELNDEIRKAMTGLLEPEFKEVQLGRAEVREIFGVPKIGTVAGCHVVEGVISRSASARLLRDNVVIHEGKIASLRRFKDDASEVRAGFDCGIRLERYQDVKPGDTIEAFVEEEVAPTL